MRDLAKDLIAGLELRVPSEGFSLPVDFAVMNSRATLVFRMDWWQKEQDLNVGIIQIDAVPSWDDEAFGWAFRTEANYLLAGPGDEDQDAALRTMRKRILADPVSYRSALARQREVWADGDDPFDFALWMDWATGLRLLPVEGETSDRRQGRIRLLDHRGEVIDALVIDENGFAATADVNGYLVNFALDWISRSPGKRPSIIEFLGEVAGQSLYGGRTFEAPQEVLGPGDLEEIALRLVVA